MKTLWLEQKYSYNGSQLEPLTNYLEHGLLGNSIVGWRGACDVTPEHMIDGEDLRHGETIAADEMVHFVLELFDFPLKGGVLLQRLMAEMAVRVLKQLDVSPDVILGFERRGDDLYLNEKKWNISIATACANSVLVHFAVNSLPTGAPVPIVSLKDLGVPPEAFGQALMKAVAAELTDVIEASQKVRTY